ncbi:MAG: DUF2147 domain-containing protein [Acidobacteria bacterium]|jgi:uncharacterized protein (DUF2147 family)|nr:DUF2147 domain-containing protein [Acidobacteriota bacterium]
MQRVPVVVVIVFLMVMPVLAGEGDAIVGLWATDPEGGGGQAHIRISADGGRYAGKIVWLEEPVYTAEDDDGEIGEPKVDTNNPDPALRSRPIMGLQMMEGFEYVGDNTWKKGTIYDPDNGKTYKCKIKLGDDGVLYVRGFIGVSLIGRTSQWTRVRDEK